MGLHLESHRQQGRENARFFNLRYEEIQSSLQFFKKILHGPWDEDFILLPPGREAKQEMFSGNAGDPGYTPAKG